MSRIAQTNNRAFMHKNIPYRYCFEEGGMIETENGIYSRTYKISPPDEDVKGSYHSRKTRMLMESILQKLAENFTFEFTIRNRYMDREEYLSKVMLEEVKNEDAYQHLRKLYNRVLEDNCDIGHNNFTREVYLTLSVEADMLEVALGKFMEAEEWIEEMFHSLYGFRIKALELAERLELLYDFYHPEQNGFKFEDKVDYDGNGFSIKSMQRMKMDTKDTIAPERYEYKARDYMRVGDFYARTFFINSIPESVPDSVLLDLASVSSNSILSVHYQSVDQELGFQVAAKMVKDNTEVRNIPIRDTVSDRKYHLVQRQERNIRDTLKIIVERMGKETVKTLSFGNSRGKMGSVSVNKQEVGRELMSRIQIEQMRNTECLVFIRALRPFKKKKYRLENHPNYKYTAEANKKYLRANPYLLEYCDEEIESVRVKPVGEEGYFEPKVVNSARKRALEVEKQKKAQAQMEVAKELDKMTLQKSDETKSKEQYERELTERKNVPKLEASDVLQKFKVSQMQILDSFSPTYEFD